MSIGCPLSQIGGEPWCDPPGWHQPGKPLSWTQVRTVGHVNPTIRKVNGLLRLVTCQLKCFAGLTFAKKLDRFCPAMVNSPSLVRHPGLLTLIAGVGILLLAGILPAQQQPASTAP